MPKDSNILKVLVIGSGPIIIGQAAEFDYAGTQACKALKEEGVEVLLYNSNPATIMTDDNIADTVYIQPITLEGLKYVIEKERPYGLIPTLGGQTALNIAVELQDSGIQEENNVKVLGTSIESIKNAENRDSFKRLMNEIEEPIPLSRIINNIDEAIEFSKEVSFPLIIRPAYTLGGTGGGIATNKEELINFVKSGLAHSRINQVLLEESVSGWKEIEYEVMRDSNDTCIVVCNMENFDPVGVHTGDSIVVVPSQTLRDEEYHLLRSSAIKIIRALKIEGGCNVQFALNTETTEYKVIEVNPRVSRSSALASKASGYPIARVAAKIALGLHLHEITNCVTQTSMASFEPALDYIVTKIPKWPFDKFSYANRKLSTQMKATGEVMAIDRNFESSLLKAIISLEGQEIGLRNKYISKLSSEELIQKLQNIEDDRIFVIAEALRRNFSINLINEYTKIDKWFLNKINNIIITEKRLSNEPFTIELLMDAESKGFTDYEITELTGKRLEMIDALRRAHSIYPVHKMVDSCAGEFESSTPYYYSTYDSEDENIITQREKIIVLGSGPIRIGQGIEFDYCSVHAAWAIKDAGYESIIINNNPETVSTDFDTSDKLYFEPLFIEDVMNIIRKEKPKGAIVQFGGQTAINLAPKLKENGLQILGTTVGSANFAEDRELFEVLLKELNIPQPDGFAVTSFNEALIAANKIGYPVLVRPSYVIGGRAMQIIYNDQELSNYIEEAVSVSFDHPILVDKYIEGKEVELDAISDYHDILIPGILEHIERTGIHSGDSIGIYPHQNLSQKVVDTLIEYTRKLAKAIRIIGLMNIQFIVDKNDKVFVLEVNPRASRTVPIMTKITGVPMVKMAVNAILRKKIIDQVDSYQSSIQNKTVYYNYGLYPATKLISVKVPVFSFQKLSNVEVALTPEMKSTGEVLGIDSSFNKAVLKGFLGANYKIPEKGTIFVSLNKKDQIEAIELLKAYKEEGFQIIATEGTSRTFNDNGLETEIINKNKLETILQAIKNRDIDIVINTPTVSKDPNRFGFKIRNMAESFNIPCFSTIDTAEVFLLAIKTNKQHKYNLTYETINYYKN
ncbi:MAG: carbamoyl-phosphate synthase large subunit [Cyanobacteriota bacterium]